MTRVITQIGHIADDASKHKNEEHALLVIEAERAQHENRECLVKISLLEEQVSA